MRGSSCFESSMSASTVPGWPHDGVFRRLQDLQELVAGGAVRDAREHRRRIAREEGVFVAREVGEHGHGLRAERQRPLREIRIQLVGVAAGEFLGRESVEHRLMRVLRLADVRSRVRQRRHPRADRLHEFGAALLVFRLLGRHQRRLAEFGEERDRLGLAHERGMEKAPEIRGEDVPVERLGRQGRVGPMRILAAAHGAFLLECSRRGHDPLEMAGDVLRQDARVGEGIGRAEIEAERGRAADVVFGRLALARFARHALAGPFGGDRHAAAPAARAARFAEPLDRGAGRHGDVEVAARGGLGRADQRQ
jgi:hypothetical protein